MCVLAIDIGGTGTKLACAKMIGSHLELSDVQIFASDSYESLESIIEEYQHESQHKCASISIAVAGPVASDRCKLTNLPWTIEGRAIADRFKIKELKLLNDLEAQGHAVAHLEDIESVNIHGKFNRQGNIAIVAPGTGLGEAFVCRTPQGGFLPVASEGGHCDFSPTNATEMALLEFVKRKHKRVSWERIISGGMGFINIYEFFIDSQRYQWDRDLDDAKRHSASAFARELFRLGKEDLLIAKEVLNLYCELLGAEAGNLILKVMATGGLVLSGGVTPHLLPFLDDTPFYHRFTHKGRFSDMLSEVPIVAITDKNVGIKGAALAAINPSV
ncbi:glucokinase [Oligoflexaceae bacterium]|nr:glucokinase [Oligoflexaceae bacterium]